MRNSSSPLPDRLRVVNPLKINVPHQQQNCCRKKVTHSCWVWCILLPWPFTCRAQPFTKGEWFYPEWRREHELMVPRRLVWKREGETSSPKTKKEVLIQCRLLSRLSQQASSNWGCPCPSQSAVPLDSRRSRGAGLQGSCYSKAMSNYVSYCIFSTLDTSSVSCASVGRGHTRTKNLASYSAAQYILHHY